MVVMVMMMMMMVVVVVVLLMLMMTMRMTMMMCACQSAINAATNILAPSQLKQATIQQTSLAPLPPDWNEAVSAVQGSAEMTDLVMLGYITLITVVPPSPDPC
jgi:hypothetical protein